MRRYILPVAACLLLMLSPCVAKAHKVGLFAYREGGTVHAEAYFADGSACRNARISVQDTAGAVIAEGSTDEEGLFSFPYAVAGDLVITVRASMGHGSEFLLAGVEPEIRGNAPEEKGLAGDGSEMGACLDEDDVNRILEEKIGPVRESLREIQKNRGKATLGKIIGGLGWIVGLAGAYLWGVSLRQGRTGSRKKGMK